MILFYEGNFRYKKKNSESKVSCLGIYATLQAARFISIVIQRTKKLNFLPIIRRTTSSLYPETSWKVDEFLKNQSIRMERQLANEQRKKLKDSAETDKPYSSASQPSELPK